MTDRSPASSSWLRSYLFAPGSRQELLAKVFQTEADAVVLDLEDAVPPTEKDDARRKVARALAAHAGEGPPCWVRINDLRSPFWQEDVVAVVGPALQGLRVPKAEDVSQLQELNEVLLEAEARAGLPEGSIGLTLTVESAVGLVRLAELGSAPRVDRLAFGGADFCADLGLDPGNSMATLYARSQMVLQSRVAQLLPPIAPVYTHLDDEPGLVATTEEAKALGFFGRSCIHPKQLSVVHRVFTPSPEEVAAAHRVLERLQGAADGGQGGTVGNDGQFIDEAVARRARRILDLSRRWGAHGGGI